MERGCLAALPSQKGRKRSRSSSKHTARNETRPSTTPPTSACSRRSGSAYSYTTSEAPGVRREAIHRTSTHWRLTQLRLSAKRGDSPDDARRAWDYKGGSQGGRVAPLAATKAQVDFVIVDYGLPESVADESRDQTVLELARKGYAHADLEAAAEVADATSDVAASHLRTVFERLERVRAKYGSRPWFGELAGPFTGRMLGYPGWVIRLVGPMLDGGTPINYDAMTVLRRVKVPMLWVLAGDDTQAPSTTTQSRLRQLAADGYPVTAVFSPAPITEYSNSRSLPTDPGQRLAILRVISRPPWTLRFEANSTGVRQGQSNRPESRHAGHARSRKPRLTALYGLGGAEVGRYVNDSLDAHPAIQSAPADQPNSVTQWYTIRSRTSDIEFRNRSVRSKLVTST